MISFDFLRSCKFSVVRLFFLMDRISLVVIHIPVIYSSYMHPKLTLTYIFVHTPRRHIFTREGVVLRA